MAKKHLKQLNNLLIKQYESVERIYTDFALETQDMIISDETLLPLQTLKNKMDNLLSTFSMGITAGMHNKALETLILNEHRASKAFNKPLLQLLDNLSTTPEDTATQRLISSYNSMIKATENKIQRLNKIRFYKDLPNRDRKAKKIILGLGYDSIETAMREQIIALLIKQREELQTSYSNFINTPIEQSTKGDLEE